MILWSSWDHDKGSAKPNLPYQYSSFSTLHPPSRLHIAPACSCAPPLCNLHPSGRSSRILEDFHTALGIPKRHAPPVTFCLRDFCTGDHRQSESKQRVLLRQLHNHHVHLSHHRPRSESFPSPSPRRYTSRHHDAQGGVYRRSSAHAGLHCDDSRQYRHAALGIL